MQLNCMVVEWQTEREEWEQAVSWSLALEKLQVPAIRIGRQAARSKSTTLAANGTTHGAKFDTVAPGMLLRSKPTVQPGEHIRVEVDAYYELSGSGIASGTRFLYDNTILSGLPGSVNLSVAATGTATSATFTAKKSVSVGVALATLTDGSASVSLTDTGGLAVVLLITLSATAAFGQQPATSTTRGGGIMIVSTALLTYDGAGGGSLTIMAATPATTTGTDEFGQTTTLTTYSIASQPVRATSSGQYPLQLNGFPAVDPTSVTDIPSSALAGLEPGLVYDITGPGIPVGATFVAPVGGTSITRDLDATTSILGEILTITGPRTPNAPFDPAAHARFDEDIISVDISQEEGGFATLTVDLKNPNIGLLALGAICGAG
jgi:hypothetical protein